MTPNNGVQGIQGERDWRESGDVVVVVGGELRRRTTNLIETGEQEAVFLGCLDLLNVHRHPPLT